MPQQPDPLTEYFREAAGIVEERCRPVLEWQIEHLKGCVKAYQQELEYLRSPAFILPCILSVLNRLGFRERGTPVGTLTAQYSDGVREPSWGKIDVRQLEECVKEELVRESASSK